MNNPSVKIGDGNPPFRSVLGIAKMSTTRVMIMTTMMIMMMR
jgi:hypothetical protein